mmetsp:Transcript_86654/g.226118  ORF Transcript_86654/g.226118 Transcript_86654/m.226118 type:complete len:275 (-) Transcript_86654:789-1613(-)
MLSAQFARMMQHVDLSCFTEQWEYLQSASSLPGLVSVLAGQVKSEHVARASQQVSTSSSEHSPPLQNVLVGGCTRACPSGHFQPSAKSRQLALGSQHAALSSSVHLRPSQNASSASIRTFSSALHFPVKVLHLAFCWQHAPRSFVVQLASSHRMPSSSASSRRAMPLPHPEWKPLHVPRGSQQVSASPSLHSGPEQNTFAASWRRTECAGHAKPKVLHDAVLTQQWAVSRTEHFSSRQSRDQAVDFSSSAWVLVTFPFGHCSLSQVSAQIIVRL